MHIRPATPADRAAIAAIILPAIRAGTTLTQDPAMPEADALAYWLAPDKTVFVAEGGGEGGGAILGTYYIRPNQTGGGSHVCNGGYVTAAAAAGQGVARRMCAHSLEQARTQGYRAMQFNFVVSTNQPAVHLWQSMGFAIVGRLPGAFAHPQAGDVDAYVMYQTL